jgi:hypothetical protein
MRALSGLMVPWFAPLFRVTNEQAQKNKEEMVHKPKVAAV